MNSTTQKTVEQCNVETLAGCLEAIDLCPQHETLWVSHPTPCCAPLVWSVADYLVEDEHIRAYIGSENCEDLLEPLASWMRGRFEDEARLIAAAPALVKALEKVERSITLAGDPELARDQYCLDVIRTALARARGE